MPKPAVWNFAVPDWEERLRKRKSLLPKLPLNQAEAERACRLFNRLRLPDVPGQPTMEEGAGEWQRDMIRPIFGSLQPGVPIGIRRASEVFAMVPKKSSKTTGGAGIMLTALLMNKRPRAEFGLIGPSHSVSELAFNQASGMVAADTTGYLDKRFHVRDHIKEIVDRTNGASLKIKTFDLLIATGGKWAGLLIDELHLMSTMHFATRVFAQLRGGMIANPEAFMIMITTQSDQPSAGVFKAELDYARAVRDGRITGDDVRLVPLIYEFSEAMQLDDSKPWENTKIWYYVMPNLGKSVALSTLITEYNKAKAKGEEAERIWGSQHLNLQIGLATHDGGWRGAIYWLGAVDETINSIDDLLARCDVVVVGGDGGGLDDLLGFAALGRDRITKDYISWCHAWCHDDVLEKRKDIAETLLDFEKAGELTIIRKDDPMVEIPDHPGTFENPGTRDIREFCDMVQKVKLSGKMPEKLGVGLDPYAISAIVDELAARNIQTEANGGCIIGIRQGAALSPATWGMERKLKDGTFWHADQAIMDFSVGNAKPEQRGNAMLITKQSAGRAKIDPLTALFNAFMLMSKNPEAAPKQADLSAWLKQPAVAV